MANTTLGVPRVLYSPSHPPRLAMRLCLLALVALAASSASAQTPAWQPTDGPPGGRLYTLVAPDGALLASHSFATFRLAGGAWTPQPALVYDAVAGGARVLNRTDTGLALSTDAGLSFAPLPATASSWQPLTVDGDAFTAHDNDSLRVSLDAGATWAAHQDTAWVTVSFGGGAPSTFPVPLQNAVGAVVEGDALLVAGTAYVFGGVYRLAPTDTAWVPLVRPGTTDIASGVQPYSLVRHGGALWFSHSAGALRSADGGATWADVTAGLPDAPAGYTLHAGAAGLVAAVRGGGALALWSGTGWTPLPSPGPFVQEVAVGDAIYAATADGVVAWDGAAWAPLPAVVASSPLPLLARGGSLFASSDGHLWRTDDGAATWRVALDAHTGLLATHGDALVATSTGGIVRSADGGATWAPTTQPVLPSTATTNRPAALVSHGGALWAPYGYERRAKHGVLIEQYGNVFRSTDDGASWTSVAAGLPTGSLGRLPVGALVATGDGLFARTAGGCAALPDGATTWAAQPCPPGASAYDLRRDGARLVARTESGLYVRNDGSTAWTALVDGLPVATGTSFFWIGGRLAGTPDGLLFVGTATDGAVTAYRLAGDTWTALPWDFPEGIRWNGFLHDGGGTLYGGSLGRGMWRRGGGIVGRETDGDAPALSLSAPWPNPTAGALTIRFSLPSASTVTLDVVDATGRRVATLADGPHAAGAHAVAWPARVASGVYTLRLATPGAALSRRVAVVR